MNKTPSYYRAPLRSRAAIVAYLLDRIAKNPRKAYGPFVWDVKLHRVDFSFDHLADVARKGESLSKDASQRYLDACRAEYDNVSESRLWDYGVEQASGSLVGRYPADTYRMLWNGSEPIADWAFDGRSGGWLVLTEFDGLTFADAFQYADAAEVLGERPFAWLRRLYRFTIQCDHDFRREAVRSEVEYQAAFCLFANVCSEVETDGQAKAREAQERATAIACAPCDI